MGVRLGLDAVRRVDAQLGHPCVGPPVVHVVGTNGKGSTSAMVEMGLRRSGRKTGMFTSPHLERVGERVRIDGRPVADDAIRRASEAVLAAEARAGVILSFFEVLTVCALLVFEEAGVDVVVLEAGLGGRLDATRLRAPWHTLITRIGRDHERFLGSTLSAIAREKAAVMVAGVPTTTVQQPTDVAAVLRGYARRAGADLAVVRPTQRPPRGLPGDHQRHNAALALAVLRRLDPRAGVESLDGVVWPGRCERVQVGGGEVIFDVAHNLDGIVALRGSMVDTRPDLLVFGCQPDKRPDDLLAALAPGSEWWWVELDGESGPPVPSARGVLGPRRTFRGPSAPQLLASIRERLARGHRVLVCGSHLLVGALRGPLIGMRDSAPPDPQDPRVAAGSVGDLVSPTSDG